MAVLQILAIVENIKAGRHYTDKTGTRLSVHVFAEFDVIHFGNRTRLIGSFKRA